MTYTISKEIFSEIMTILSRTARVLQETEETMMGELTDREVQLTKDVDELYDKMLVIEHEQYKK